jgi:DNA polymerase III subunit delta'
MSESLHFDVVGAEGPKRHFESITCASLAHAYLFSGAPGVGKKTFARRLAQSLLCLAPKKGLLGYDATCSSCALFAAGENARHPDFLEHAGTLKIGDRDAAMGFYEGDGLSARDVVRQLSMQSYSGGMRVLLLGDVDFATHHAANAMLKFLEEPPRGVLMILTTASPGRLLATIRSRLIEIRFPLLSKDAVRRILEGLHYGDADAQLGASLSAGSVTRALAALEGEEESLRAAVARWFFECVAGRSPENGWASRDSLDDGLEVLKTLVRDWIVAGSIDGRDVPAAAIDYADRLGKLRPLSAREAVELLAKIDDAQRLARTNVSPVMVAEIVRMALVPPPVTKNA